MFFISPQQHDIRNQSEMIDQEKSLDFYSLSAGTRLSLPNDSTSIMTDE